MTREEAIQWVHDHTDDSSIDHDELREAFRAVVGHWPNPERYEDEDTFGQWSLLCAEAGY